MRLLICAGGTGGGVYPALAVLQAVKTHKTKDPWKLQEKMDTVQKNRIDTPDSILWVGSNEGLDVDLLDNEDVPFEGISAAGIHGVRIADLPGNAFKLMKGYFQSRQILKRFRPDVLFFTGGYLAVPMAAAGRGYPSLLFVPDIEPGMALKSISRLADSIDITAEESRRYYRHQNKVRVTGYPTRSNLKSWTKEAAYTTLGLNPQLLTALVMGGSKGARSINQALFRILPEVLEDIQVVHISGRLDWPEAETVVCSLQETCSKIDRYHPYEYLHDEMGAALTAADIVISRAGASVLGEYPLFGLPAILVPYPYAWHYQVVNARYLADRDAAVIVYDEDLQDNLLPQLQELISNNELRVNMGKAMGTLKTPDAAENIASHLREMAATSHERT